MRRTVYILSAVVVLSGGWPTSALADKVTLTNGDTLHGEVKEEAGRVRIQHAILGNLDLARSDVMWIQREGEAPPAAATPASPGTGTGICGCPPAACAEEKAVEKCPSPWDFAIGFGISNENGNTDKFGLNADLETGWKRGPNEFRWRVNSFYEEANGVQTEGKYFSNLKYGRKVSARGTVLGLSIVDRDDFADIELRNGLFGGYAHDFYKTKRTTFGGALGAGYLWEKRTGVDWIETPAGFAQLHYDHEFSTGDSFKATVYVIPYLDYIERSPTRLELRYAHPLRDHLDLTAGFLLDYVPDPPTSDIKSYDTKVTFGVRWKP